MRPLLLFLSAVAATAGTFCSNGVAWPTELATGPVRVTVLEAPLFSLNPSVGKLPGELAHAFHVALLFETPVSNYTLEYDAVDNVAAASIPVILANGTLVWSNDARWCLREGLLYGRSHWSQRYTFVGTLKPDAFRSIGIDFVLNSNTSKNAFGLGEYSFTQVMTGNKVLFHDNTCATGTMAVLAYAVNRLNTTLDVTASVPTSHFTLRADHIELANVSDAAVWADVVAFYQQMKSAASQPSVAAKLLAILKLGVGWRYVYRGGVYYELKYGLFGTVAVIKYEEAPFGIYVNGSDNDNNSRWARTVSADGLPR